MLGNRRVLECSQDKGRQGQTPSGSPPGVSALATARFPRKKMERYAKNNNNSLECQCNVFWQSLKAEMHDI